MAERLPLGTRCYVDGEARERALRSLDSLLENDIGGLDVTREVSIRDGFPVVELSGPDATAARNVLRETWGVATRPGPGEVGVGTLTAWDDEGVVLTTADGPVRVPREELGLGPGTPGEIRTRYGLVQHVPLRFVGGERPRLADAERDRLYDWTRGDGRVNVNSATRAEVRATVNRAGHARDIVTVERLGLLEQSIVCGPETDPPGLLASIGEYLPAELLCVVS